MPTRTTTVTTYDKTGKQTSSQTVTYDVTVEQDNRDQILTKLGKALDTNKAYRKLATPTALDQATQIAELTRQMSYLIRNSIGQLDSTD